MNQIIQISGKSKSAIFRDLKKIDKNRLEIIQGYSKAKDGRYQLTPYYRIKK